MPVSAARHLVSHEGRKAYGPRAVVRRVTEHDLGALVLVTGALDEFEGLPYVCVCDDLSIYMNYSYR